MSDGTRQCEACGMEVRAEWKLCPGCGGKLPGPSSACGACGTEVQPEWKRCPECGAELPASASGAAAGPASFSDRPATVLKRPSGAAPASPAARPGASTGARYQVEAEIGRGGMGVVSRATDTVLGRTVALKRMLPEAAADRTSMERFMTEARAVARVQHPNVVTVFDAGEDEEGFYIAMELVEGRGLDRVLAERGALPEPEALRILRGLCEGLSVAHRHGIVHRDIKPGNIILGQDGVPRLTDFGLARVGAGSDLSRTGMGMGTWDYAAPEQKTDARSADHRSDVYALGATFYELLTGHRPPPHPDQIPERWREVILRACHPEPARRPFSVDEFWSGIEAVGPAPAPAAPRPFPGGPRPAPAVKPFGGDSKLHPELAEALRAQILGRGLAKLGLKTGRTAAYQVVSVLTIMLFIACVGDEFRDDELSQAFAIFFAIWAVGFWDVYRTWNERQQER